jgi:ribosomal protein S18 acetylase RimI-like enzyme
MTMIRFLQMQREDLRVLPTLQPLDWPDIVPDFSFYLWSGFCHPHIALWNGGVVGVGSLAILGKTGWLAHVIVHPEFRNRGIGSRIVTELLSLSKAFEVETLLLAATAQGRSVYRKAGFRTVGRYTFLAREKPWIPRPPSHHIEALGEAHHPSVLALDRLITGESRAPLISGFFEEGLVYLSEGAVWGVYLPHLKEGYIGAVQEAAGLALMEIKYAERDTAVVPTKNRTAFRFLKENGFAETGRVAYRMVLGQDVEWRPEHLFGRIGGNFG